MEERIDMRKFTSLGEEHWQAQHAGITDEQYMIERNRAVSVPLE
jgi:hypothetical protein